MAIYFHQKRRSTLLVLACSAVLMPAVSLSAFAQDASSEMLSCDQQMHGSQADAQSEAGNTEFSKFCTKSLLEMQRSGSVASEYKQKLPAVVLDEILERLENSFTHPVPEYFVSTEFTSSE